MVGTIEVARLHSSSLAVLYQNLPLQSLGTGQRTTRLKLQTKSIIQLRTKLIVGKSGVWLVREISVSNNKTQAL